ncbi:hypothetical protein, partial [Mesorhizobium sp. M0643]|uniref:hypothetical protein n=1 Tax=Mesorhizobium sp. M0643 TaxID=2956978 RepID=UPI00333604A2
LEPIRAHGRAHFRSLARHPHTFVRRRSGDRPSKAMAVALAKHFKFEFMLTVALILLPVLRRRDR